ncbi:16S rRNA (uracil(1498)-N(3))-methyltransferase [Naasia aerilata]|uniref:Ribosomal RNA small subunit methyltransferase E n=1 Tax=Naasia aerilata TaxID=1162966 RepID=A0ABM8GEB4_9MICO|nr:16S rRNA (uracil(1498)-N(3))-methyltransferase [Naasia aerilata]BDZ46639.1 ribosomal RNA small subunit methyltransferase E [Naasia aerilata]
MAHFYLIGTLEGAAIGHVVALEGAEARHAAAVSRVRAGEKLAVGDGRGTVATGAVESATPSEVLLRVERLERTPAPAREILLVQALAKGDRDELAIQAATELGVDRIVPWQAERSVSRWSADKAERGRERWATIVREAVKQSMRPWLPEVAPLAQRADVAALASAHAVLVLEPTAETSFAAAVETAAGRPLALVVGPEGGVSAAELAAFAAAGAVAVRLGPEVLRTSTAGPAALAALGVLTGRWS